MNRILPSPIFRKLLLTALAMIAVTFTLLDFYLTRYSAQYQVATVENQLILQARVLRREAADLAPDKLPAWAAEAAVAAQVRITIINAEGLVLADSEHDPALMENHAGRPEIREAYRGRQGFSVRHSATLDRDLCYLALPLSGGRPGWVIRLALPLQDVHAAVASLRWQIVGSSVVVALLALGVAWYFFRRFTRRVRRLQVFAEHLLEPSRADVLDADARDELGALAISLSRAGSPTKTRSASPATTPTYARSVKGPVVIWRACSRT